MRTQEEAGGQCWEAPDDPRPDISQPEGKQAWGFPLKRASQPCLLCTFPNQQQKAKLLKIIMIKKENQPPAVAIPRLQSEPTSWSSVGSSEAPTG